MKSLKHISRDWMPPMLLDLYRRYLGGGIRFTGHYRSWQAASLASTGYDADNILECVSTASLKVKAGEAIYERDSMLFDVVEHNFPLLALLLKAASDRQGRLNVLDFGGSLGSVYRQCKHFLPSEIKLNWCIVEQEKFVQHGRQYFADDELKFFFSIEECVKTHAPDIVLFASVLQYLEHADRILDSVIDTGVDYIMVDRTPFVALKEDWISVQKVPENIYKAKYPCAMMSKSRLEAHLNKRYIQLAEFDALGGQGSIDHGLRRIPFEYKGMIWRKR